MSFCAQCGGSLPEGARFCPSCAAPVEESAPSDERKLATVLFADLVGSTALAGSQDPERTRAVLARFYDAMAAEIDGAGGTIEKFAGDAVMAVFGAPSAQEDHAERALHAALAMQRRLEELFGDSLRLRIGVNTGEVMVGRAREGSSFVSGDSVNVAARLEQTAAPGAILVGERTVAVVRGAFEFGEPETVEAKGKPGGVACRRLVRALSLMRPRGVGGLRQSFVGREAELELLQATYRRVVSRREPHLITIMGDAGVGKTRLVRELWAWLGAQEPQPLQRTGRCLPYGQVTYWALGEVLKEHLGILESDSPEAALQRLGAQEILGLCLGLDVAGDLHPLAARERLHAAWTEFIEELVAAQPAVVLVEDLHWAEDPLLDLIDRLTRDVRGPLLVIGTARPELGEHAARIGLAGMKRNASFVWLDPLSLDQAQLLVEQLLATPLPRELSELVVGRAEGNPFFVEELIATLIDLGVLEREDGNWSVREVPAGFTVPDSIQAIVSARIDLLGAGEKAMLQTASVIGRVFWTGPVRELLAGAEADWRLLEDRDFVRRRSGSSMAGQTEYAFKHAVTREVAYESLPKATRAHLHAAFARWLEREGEGRDEHAAFLAHHFAEAVRPEQVDLAWAGNDQELQGLRTKAVHWLERAADLAVRRYEIDEGLSSLYRALELEHSRSGQARLWHAIGRAHAFKFEGEQFWTAMQRAIELSDDEGEIADLYSDLALQTAGRAGMWKRLPEPELVEGWVDQALALAEPGTETRVKALLARAMWDAGPAGDAAAVQAGAAAEELDNPDLRSSVFVVQALSAHRAGRYEEASAWAERPLDFIDEIRDPDLVADVYGAAVPPSLARGRFDEARRLARLFEEVNDPLTSHHRVHGVSVPLEVEELVGNWQGVVTMRPRIEQAVDANLTTPCIRNPRSLLVCAVASAYVGDTDAARRLEERAEEMHMEGYGLILGGPRMRLALARKDLARVEELLVATPSERSGQMWLRVSSIAARLDALAATGDRFRVEEEAPPLIKPGTYLEPIALRALGLVRQDEELIRQAVERFEAMGLDWHAAETRELLSA